MVARVRHLWNKTIREVQFWHILPNFSHWVAAVRCFATSTSFRELKDIYSIAKVKKIIRKGTAIIIIVIYDTSVISDKAF